MKGQVSERGVASRPGSCLVRSGKCGWSMMLLLPVRRGSRVTCFRLPRAAYSVDSTATSGPSSTSSVSLGLKAIITPAGFLVQPERAPTASRRGYTVRFTLPRARSTKPSGTRIDSSVVVNMGHPLKNPPIRGGPQAQELAIGLQHGTDNRPVIEDGLVAQVHLRTGRLSGIRSVRSRATPVAARHGQVAQALPRVGALDATPDPRPVRAP